MARMAVSWDTPGVGGETGRIRTEKGTFYGKFQHDGQDPVPATFKRHLFLRGWRPARTAAPTAT